MTAEITHLIWHGAETVEEAAAPLRRRDVQRRLPVNFHRALRPREARAAVEAIGGTGGAELRARFDGIQGLERVATLVDPAQRVGAQAQVVSPAPLAAIRLRDAAYTRVK